MAFIPDIPDAGFADVTDMRALEVLAERYEAAAAAAEAAGSFVLADELWLAADDVADRMLELDPNGEF